MPETEQGQALPVTLKIFAVLSLLGGIVECIVLWPRWSDLDELRSLLGTSSAIRPGPAAYVAPISFLAAGILSCCVLWALAEILIQVRYLSGAQEVAARQAASARLAEITTEPAPVLEEGQWRCRCGRIVEAVHDHCSKCGRAKDAII